MWGLWSLGRDEVQASPGLRLTAESRAAETLVQGGPIARSVPVWHLPPTLQPLWACPPREHAACSAPAPAPAPAPAGPTPAAASVTRRVVMSEGLATLFSHVLGPNLELGEERRRGLHPSHRGGIKDGTGVSSPAAFPGEGLEGTGAEKKWSR